MKKIILSLALLVAIILEVSTPVLAQDNLGAKRLINSAPRLENQASRSTALQQQRLQNIIKKADTMITERVNSLSNLSTRVQNDKKLTPDVKAALNEDIQTNINDLNKLKAKIDADTDVQTALTDAKQIVTNFKVYMVLEPKLQLLITLNNLQTMVTNLQTVTPKLQTLINSLKSQGRDVSKLTPLIADIDDQLQTISTAIGKDITIVEAVTPTTTNPQTVFTKVRQDVKKTLIGGFNKIQDDIRQMRTIFKKVIVQERVVSPTPLATATSSSNTAQ